MNLERNQRISEHFSSIKSSGKVLELPEGKIKIDGSLDFINGLLSVVESDIINFKCVHEITLDNEATAMHYDIVQISKESFLTIKDESLKFRQQCFNQEAQMKIDSATLTDEEFEALLSA